MRRSALPFALLFAVVLGGVPSFAGAAVSLAAPGGAPLAASDGASLAAPDRLALAAPDRLALASFPGAAPVNMVLLSQSAWNSATKPLTLKVLVRNGEAVPLTDIALTLTIGFPARSRTTYEESLVGDPTGQLFTTSFFARGSIPARDARAFTIRQALDAVPGISQDSLLYPLRVELRAQDVLKATLRTPMILLDPAANFPRFGLGWTFALSVPMQEGPDGIFQPGPIEADIAPSGRIASIVDALDREDLPAVDVAVSPVLLEELRQMQDGYRIVRPGGSVQTVDARTAGAADAARVLAALRRVSNDASVELVAQPFGDALLPAIQRSGLGNLATLVDRGREAVQAAVGREPSAVVIRPPQSQTDQRSFTQLVQAGASAFLFDPNFIRPPTDIRLSPPSVAEVVVRSWSARAVLPDADLTRLTRSYPADPLLAAHAALGLMAAKWLEVPASPNRGIAALFGSQANVPPAMYAAMMRLVIASPWMLPQKASVFVSNVPPLENHVDHLPVRSYPSFAPGYVSRLRSAQGTLRVFRATALGPQATAIELQLARDLLTAEAGTFVTLPALGLRYIQQVDGPFGVIQQTYDQVGLPPDSRIFTLASGSGPITLPVRNNSPYRLDVSVGLDEVPGLTVTEPPGGSMALTLGPGVSMSLQFEVSAESTGRYLTVLRVRNGARGTIATSQVVVRSTAYNRVALVITIGAGLFLAVWWGRGVLRRRRS
jgi:hypothetical protein